MYYFSFDGFRKEEKEYLTYRPNIKDVGEKLAVAICLLTKDSAPNGMFRVACNGQGVFNIHFKLGDLLGNDPLPGTQFHLNMRPEEILFKENNLVFCLTLNY